MIVLGEQAFNVRHSSGGYLGFYQSKFVLRHDYFNFFKKETGICLKDIHFNEYLTMLEEGKISVQSDCFQFVYSNDSMIRKRNQWTEAMFYDASVNDVKHAPSYTVLQNEQWETNAARFYFIFSMYEAFKLNC